MAKHLQKEIEKTKKMILALSAAVEEAVRKAIKAVETRDAGLAEKIIANDPTVDEMEVDVEEEVLKILALHQPVAIDLRFLVSALKINNDLERIGDLAVNLAERAIFLSSFTAAATRFDLRELAEKVQWMLRSSLDSLVNLDAALARKVCVMDDDVDEIHRGMYRKVEDAMVAHPEQAAVILNWLTVSRYLERIADHATNIAEDVIYMIEGEIVRHKPELGHGDG